MCETPRSEIKVKKVAEKAPKMGVKYCCGFCRFQAGCNRGACAYAYGHSMIQHREAGDCEIENMICYAWHPGDTGARLGQSKHWGCWENRLK